MALIKKSDYYVFYGSISIIIISIIFPLYTTIMDLK